MNEQKGFTLWLTGLSGSGKSTLARATAGLLVSRGQRVEILDGDDIRKAVSGGLGFTREDRDTNVQRVGFVANLLSRNGVAVMVAAISPYRQARAQARNSHDAPFLEILVDCALDELIRRDTKGLYAKALTGTLQHFTGISDPYEPPIAPDLHLRTDRETVQESLARILAVLVRRGLITRSASWPLPPS